MRPISESRTTAVRRQGWARTQNVGLLDRHIRNARPFELPEGRRSHGGRWSLRHHYGRLARKYEFHLSAKLSLPNMTRSSSLTKKWCAIKAVGPASSRMRAGLNVSISASTRTSGSETTEIVGMPCKVMSDELRLRVFLEADGRARPSATLERRAALRRTAAIAKERRLEGGASFESSNGYLQQQPDHQHTSCTGIFKQTTSSRSGSSSGSFQLQPTCRSALHSIRPKSFMISPRTDGAGLDDRYELLRPPSRRGQSPRS